MAKGVLGVRELYELGRDVQGDYRCFIVRLSVTGMEVHFTGMEPDARENRRRFVADNCTGMVVQVPEEEFWVLHVDWADVGKLE